MKKREDEEIVAYRIGDRFLCPKCYEMNVKILSVQEMELPSNPVKKGEIEGFVCNQCKLIKGDYKVQSVQDLRDLQNKLEILDEPKKKKPGERRHRSQDEFTDLEDMMEDIFCKVQFIEDYFNPNVPLEEIFSDKGRTGFYHILIDLEDDIEFVQDGMSMIKNKEGRKDSGLAGSKITTKDSDVADGLLKSIEIARSTGEI